MTIDIPSELTERIASTPETVLITSSIGLVTEVSISSALAPGSVVVTAQTGKSTLGNRSTPSRKYDKIPSTTGEATSTQVKTGRRMQMSEMLIVTQSSSVRSDCDPTSRRDRTAHGSCSWLAAERASAAGCSLPG